MGGGGVSNFSLCMLVCPQIQNPPAFTPNCSHSIEACFFFICLFFFFKRLGLVSLDL